MLALALGVESLRETVAAGAKLPAWPVPDPQASARKAIRTTTAGLKLRIARHPLRPALVRAQESYCRVDVPSRGVAGAPAERFRAEVASIARDQWRAGTGPTPTGMTFPADLNPQLL